MSGTVDVLVSVADGGVVTVLLGNYGHSCERYNFRPARRQRHSHACAASPTRCPPTPPSEYIDDTHANPYATWRAARPHRCTQQRDEIEAEMAASAAQPTMLPVEGVRATVAVCE